MSFSLRAAAPADYEALCALFAELDAMHREALPRVFQPVEGVPRPRERFMAILADAEQQMFVAESGGALVGFVHVLARSAPDIPLFLPRRFAVIDDLLVTRLFRRQGIGRALLERAHRWVMEKGLTQVELNVWEFNREAFRFYEKLGYTTASRRMWTTLK